MVKNTIYLWNKTIQYPLILFFCRKGPHVIKQYDTKCKPAGHVPTNVFSGKLYAAANRLHIYGAGFGRDR